MKDADANIEAVSQALRGIVEGKLDAALAQFDDSAKWRVPAGLPGAGTYENKDGIGRLIGTTRERYGNDLHLLHLTLHGTKDAVFAEYTRSGTSDPQAKGAEHCAAVFEMVFGKIREVREFVHRA